MKLGGQTRRNTGTVRFSCHRSARDDKLAVPCTHPEGNAQINFGMHFYDAFASSGRRMMDLDVYLRETEYATRAQLDAIWHEFGEIEEMQVRVVELERMVVAEYAAADSIMADAETADDVMLGVGRYWENYFGADQQQDHQRNELDDLKEARDARAFALGALAGAVLQIAKQGLSSAYGSVTQWPNGREVGGQMLREVIRGARNQAEHWEEHRFNPDTTACFEQLHADFGPDFEEYSNQNMAMPVLQTLGWRSYEHFLADMRTFVTAAAQAEIEDEE